MRQPEFSSTVIGIISHQEVVSLNFHSLPLYLKKNLSKGDSDMYKLHT